MIIRQKLSQSNSEKWEAYGDLDRAKCNQGAGVVISPPLPQPISSPLTVSIEVCSGKGNSSHISSDSFEFTYMPVERSTSGECEIPAAFDILPENLAVTDLIDAMAHFVREPVHVATSLTRVDTKNQDWQDLSSTLTILHQRGDLSAAQFKELQGLVTLEDAILLQAFRSTKKSFSESEFLDVFRHYLSGLTISQ